MKNKNITIDDLATMINKGFANTATKEHVEHLEEWAAGRFNNIEKSLKDIRKQLTGIIYRHEFEELEVRVKDLENLLAFNSKKQ